jgi:hypothetical protein
LDLIEEEFFYPAFELLSGTLTKQFFALSSMPEALIVVVDIENDFVPEIDSLILTTSFPYIITPLSL